MRRWFRPRKNSQLPQPASGSRRFSRLPSRIDPRSMRTGHKPPLDPAGGLGIDQDLRYGDPFDG